jgi:hypothetical protein
MIGTRCQSNLRRLWSSHRTATPLRGITPRDQSTQPDSEPNWHPESLAGNLFAPRYRFWRQRFITPKADC